MKFTCLGSGSSFVLAKENYHSSFLIESEGDNLLFDAGNTTADALDAQGFTPEEIKNIYISHPHGDHFYGLEYLGFKTYYSKFPFGRNRPHLYGVADVLERVWDYGLRAGMEYLTNATGTLETYFDVDYLSMDGEFPLGANVMCFPMITTHVVSDKESMPSYGLLIDNAIHDTNIFITGDTQFNEDMALKYYPGFDTIFHDCELADYPNSVHAQYRELVKLPEAIKAKMWLYHYKTDGGKVELPDAVADGFLGFVKRGDTFEF